MSPEFPSTTLSALSLSGGSGGLVKRLRGFRKDRHTVPDGVTPVTESFFARICTEDLAEDAETWFQRIRSAFGYKRAELRLELGAANALLLARDFSLELAWALDASQIGHYTTTRTLRDLRDASIVLGPACESAFAGTFSRMVFTLLRGVSVEAVIDAVEALPETASMRVSYPADCGECTLTVAGVDANVRCTGSSLEMEFGRPGSPGELIEAFGQVRAAFRLSEDTALGGLL